MFRREKGSQPLCQIFFKEFISEVKKLGGIFKVLGMGASRATQRSEMAL
jgi:hypothetical protein